MDISGCYEVGCNWQRFYRVALALRIRHLTQLPAQIVSLGQLSDMNMNCPIVVPRQLFTCSIDRLAAVTWAAKEKRRPHSKLILSVMNNEYRLNWIIIIKKKKKVISNNRRGVYCSDNGQQRCSLHKRGALHQWLRLPPSLFLSVSLSTPLSLTLFKYLGIDADAVAPAAAAAAANDDDVELALIVAALGDFDNFVYPVFIGSGCSNVGYHRFD